MTEISIHNVEQIKLMRIEKFDTFFSRHINIINENNETIELTLFAKNRNSLIPSKYLKTK